MKSKLLSILAVAILLLSVLALSACDLFPVEPPKDEDDEAYRAIYRLYVDNAESNGEIPQDYEEWLSDIRGEDGKDGKDGITPRLRINQESGEWEISIDNGKTWKSLGFSAIGAKGDKGDDGITPKLRITDGWWEVSYDNGATWESLGVKATGEKGDKGDPGDPGTSSVCQHNLSDWIVISEPSCENIGISYRSCSECGYVEHNFTEKTAHNFVTFFSVIGESCNERYDLQYCTKCNANHTEIIGGDHLSVVIDEAVEPTCAESGLTEGSHCDTCGAVIVAQTTVPALGHNPVIDARVEPTCTETGLTLGVHCDTCGEILVKQETLSKIPHNMVDGVCTVCGCSEEEFDITIWTSELYGAAELAKKQIDRFLATHPEYNYKINIVSISEYDAAYRVLEDPASAPDIYCFSRDQYTRLIQAGLLTKLSQQSSEKLQAENDAISVKSASINGDFYAYPLTSDNGYYLYYDKSVITDPTSLEQIIADCEAAGLKFKFDLSWNSWYIASFFFATGCHSTWITDENGEFIGVDDDFNSEAGLIAMKGMQKLTQSSCYSYQADIFTEAGAIVTGVWNDSAAKKHFGDNLGATKLPSFTVDGVSYQLGSFAGNKLMGITPQEDEEKAAFCDALAQYLCGEECQMERYEAFQWGPSNKAAQASDEVQADVSLKALIEQSEYAVPQGSIHGSWWDIAKFLGQASETAETDADLQAALDDYTAMINTVLPRTEEEKNAWSVIGDICGTSWDIDFVMTKIDDTTWLSNPLELNEGEQFKVRQGCSWNLNFGSDGINGGANFYVEVSGTYRVKLVWNGGDTAEVSLIPAE